ncbi:uncharacterized protein Dwil_GK19921 [Drosophila willistoni]|uniref:DUF4773 domain-containing protein n=1 Tax=Drosophila willistoni TaxID=7260 RepID=B4MSE0_DROWI|nr:uncharacterized protein Dwil_GK19921 [Drosophila willistoni]
MFSSIEAGASASFLAHLIAIITCLISLTTARSYSNGLIFYELASHTPYLPPTVSVSRGRNLASVKYSEKGSIWSTFGQPCECRGPVCGCCAGLKVDQYKFDQKVCANVTFVPQVEEAQLEVYLNERPSSKYGISVRNPIPFCIPVMMGVPMAMCVQMTDVAIMNNQLNMCMDFVVRLATTDLFEMHFQCMRMGLDGLQYVDKNGKPVLPTTQNKDDEEETPDHAGESDLKPNEVIETITMMHNYTVHGEKEDEEKTQETTTIPELANVSENEINIDDDDDDDDADKKDTKIEDEAKKEQDDDEGEVEGNDDDDEDDDGDDAGADADEEDNDDNSKPKEAKENQSANGNESSSNSRQAVDDLANEVFNQSKRRRLRL